MKILFWGILLLLAFSSSAQNKFGNYTTDELDSIRTHLQEEKRFEEALLYASEVYESIRHTDTVTVKHAEAVFTLGILYYYTGQYEQALDYLSRAKKLTEVQVDTFHISWIARVNGYLGYCYDDIGEYKQAEVYYKEAIEWVEQSDQKNTEYHALQLADLGFLYTRMDEIELAMQFYEKAKIIYEKEFPDGRHENYVQLLARIAAVHDFYLQDFQTAEELYLKVLHLSQEIPDYDPLMYATNVSKLAGMYQQTGAYRKSLSLYKETQEIYINNFGEQHPIYAAFLSNLAFLYTDMKDYAKAEEYYKKSLAIDSITVGTDYSGYAITLVNLATLYEQQEKYEAAEKNYLRAIAINEKVLGKDSPDYLLDVKNLGYLYFLMGKYAKSEKVLLDVLEKEKQTETEAAISLGITSYYLGKVKKAQKKWQESLEYFGYALSTYFPELPAVDWDNLPKFDNYYSIANREVVKTLDQVAQLYELQYQSTKDIGLRHKRQQILQYALHINNRVQKSFSNEADKYTALHRTSELVEQALHNAHQIYNTSQNIDNEILDYTEQNKSILLSQTIDNQNLANLNILPDSIQAMEEALEQEASEIKALMADANSAQDSSTANTKQNRWSIKRSQLDQLLRKKYPKYFQSKKQQSKLLVDTVHKNIPTGTMLITYFVGNKQTYLIGITKDDFYLHELTMDKKLLNEHITTFRESLSDYKFILNSPAESYQNYTQEAQWFYTNLLQPILIDTSVSNLVIIADGNLGHLPFEVFLTKPVSLQNMDYSSLPYLLHKYTISYNYAVKLWLENQQPRVLENNNRVLGYAPTYNQDTTQLSTIRDPEWVKMRSHLIPLPATSSELDNISKIYAGTYRKGMDAHEQKFKQEAEAYSIIHLAMHGILDQKNPILSSMAFSENKDTTADNFLQVHEIYQLDLNAELIVLSACETGYGKFQQGEGILSLARSFMYAGTPALVVSLWQVNDQATAIIMELFYQNIAKGLPKDVALQNAKLTYIQKADGAAQHPAFWSAFIAIGDNQPIVTQTKKSPTLWLIIGLGGLLTALGLGWWVKSKKAV